MWMWRRRWGQWQLRWVTIGVAGAGVLALVAALWPSSKTTYDPPTRARQYVAFSACLLTGPAGLADSVTRQVWVGMQTASSATRAQVTYLSAGSAGESIGSVTPFVNSLVAQRCALVLAVGSVEVEAVQSTAVANPGVHFVLVGGGSVAVNVAVVEGAPSGTLSARVATVVEGAVEGDFRGCCFVSSAG